MRIKQIEESQRMIVEGFFALIARNDYDSITMSDISSQAQVSRMTLYRHFRNKADIIKFYITHVIKQVEQNISKNESPNLATILYERNRLIYEDKKLREAFRHEILEDIFKEMIFQSRMLFNKYVPQLKNISKYKRLFAIGGINNITKEWVLNGMKETPEQITMEIMNVVSLLR